MLLLYGTRLSINNLFLNRQAVLKTSSVKAVIFLRYLREKAVPRNIRRTKKRLQNGLHIRHQRDILKGLA